MLDLYAPIDLYCERISTLFWAEPINALTNVFFVLVGLYTLVQLKRRKIKDRWIFFMGINTILIGIGSFLFHTYANFISMWADVLPIIILICSSFAYALKKVYRYNNLVTCFGAFAFLGIGFFLQFAVPPLFNGSIVYTHAFVGLIVIGLTTQRISQDISRGFTYAALIFTLSLFFRTVDPRVCDSFPLGTHFLWHTLNGLVIFFVQRGLVNFSEDHS